MDRAALGELDGRHRWRDLERGKKRLWVLEPVAIERMDRDVRAGRGGNRGVIADVIPMAVRRDDELQRPVAGGQLVGDPGKRRRRRVDRDRLSRARVGQDVDVGGDRPDDAADALYVTPRAWL
jgi:hypothetical protein